MDKTQKWGSGWNSPLVPGRVFASRSALLAAVSGSDRREPFELLKNDLAAKYPSIGLSFGYLGNIWPGEDDRDFFFFTKVPHPDGSGRFKYELGDMESLRKLDVEKLLPRLEEWIVKRVLPHAHASSPGQ